MKAHLLPWHRWTGLALGLFLSLQALTGTLLLFRAELDRLVHPALIVTPQAEREPVEAMLSALAHRLPEHSLSRIHFPEATDQAILVRLKAKEGGERYLAAVDPYTARVVRHGGVWSWPTEALFLLHNEFLSGKTGHQLVGILGLSLIVLLITGPIIWWPGHKRIRKGLSVTFKNGPNRGFRELHRAAGALSAAILLLSGSTGVLMVWQVQVRQAARSVWPIIEKPAPKVPEATAAPFLPLDRLIRKAQADYGPTRLQQLRFSGKDERIVAVYLAAEMHGRPEASKQVWFDRSTGEDLGHHVAGALPPANEVLDWAFTIHTGKFPMSFGRLVLFPAGVVLIGLTLTGAWMWYGRHRQLKSRRRKPVPKQKVHRP